MLIFATVASEVVPVILAVCPAVGSTRLDNCPAFVAGMTLYGGEEVVKCVKFGGPGEGRLCHRRHGWLNVLVSGGGLVATRLMGGAKLTAIGLTN